MTNRDGYTKTMIDWCEHVQISGTSAEALCANYGGIRRTIPKNLPPTDSHWLIACIGRDDAQRMVSYYCGEEIDIPLGPSAPKQIVHRRIRELDKEGVKYGAIARQLGISKRTVIRHVKGTSNKQKDVNQFELFPDHHPRPRSHPKP